MEKKKISPIQMSMVNPNAAGIDIGSKEHWVAVSPDRDENPVRSFSTFTEGLHSIVKWLKECEVTTIAMESTGVYWIPLFLILEEHGFEVFLVNASHTKNVSGRKTDEKDCMWIQKLHSFGLLSASFQPDLKTRELRSYVRHKKNLTQSAQVHVLRMQKALEQMNVKLHHVITDITGKSGRMILKAILKGERDGKILADMLLGRAKEKKEDTKKSLQGNWKDEHLFELRQSLELFEFYEQKILECELQIENIISQFGGGNSNIEQKDSKGNTINDLKGYLINIFGIDVTEIWGIKENTGIELLSEVGSNMGKWKSEKHFTSWLGLAPNNKITGGKTLSSKIPKKHNKAGQLFRMIAYSIQRSDHWLALFYKRIRAKGGPKTAIVATARKLAVIFYKAVSLKRPFIPLKREDYEEIFKTQKIKALEKQALKLGLLVTSG
jgi:transposase